VSSSAVTVTLVGGVAGARPGTISNGPSPRTPPAGVACAVHFNEPSGQYASGHVCSGAKALADVRSEKGVSGRCRPRGHGIPHVVPSKAVGARPSSQRAHAPGPGLAATASEDPVSWMTAPRRGSSGVELTLDAADVSGLSAPDEKAGVRGRAAGANALAARKRRREIPLRTGQVDGRLRGKLTSANGGSQWGASSTRGFRYANWYRRRPDILHPRESDFSGQRR
jgi:hypothetical protein